MDAPDPNTDADAAAAHDAAGGSRAKPASGNMDFEQDDQKRQSVRPGDFGGQAPTTDRSVVDEQFAERVTSLVNEEPRTVREVHEVFGQSAGLTREQTDYRLGKLSQSGAIQSKKSPGKTGPKIFYSGDTE